MPMIAKRLLRHLVVEVDVEELEVGFAMHPVAELDLRGEHAGVAKVLLAMSLVGVVVHLVPLHCRG